MAMTWAEKTKLIVEVDLGVSYRKIEERAGWSYNTLKSAIKKNAVVGVDKAIGLARALNVSVEWLFDDERGWEESQTGRLGDRPPEPEGLHLGHALQMIALVHIGIQASGTELRASLARELLRFQLSLNENTADFGLPEFVEFARRFNNMLSQFVSHPAWKNWKVPEVEPPIEPLGQSPSD